MVTLFRADRPETGFMSWYLERKHRCLEQTWSVASEFARSGADTVLELGLVRRADRADFYQRVDRSDCELVVYVLETPEETRRQRVRARNLHQGASFKMAVRDEIFELANRLWEPPDETECRERQIRFIGVGAGG